MRLCHNKQWIEMVMDVQAMVDRHPDGPPNDDGMG
jgi:hypothetical protein